MHAVIEARVKEMTGLQRQPGLADAARTNQRQEPNRGRCQPFDDQRHLGFAADQRRHREGQRSDPATDHIRYRGGNEPEGIGHRISRMSLEQVSQWRNDTRF